MRPGHHRPVGSVTARWRLRWPGERKPAPELGDLVYEEPFAVERGYEVVGVEETRNPGMFGVYLERLAWPDFLARSLRAPDDRVWAFTRDR